MAGTGPRTTDLQICVPPSITNKTEQTLALSAYGLVDYLSEQEEKACKTTGFDQWIHNRKGVTSVITAYCSCNSELGEQRRARGGYVKNTKPPSQAYRRSRK